MAGTDTTDTDETATSSRSTVVKIVVVVALLVAGALFVRERQADDRRDDVEEVIERL